MKTALALLLAALPLAAQGVIAPFERLQLTGEYFSEGASVGDLNGDGIPDVTSGPFWWEGPNFLDRHEFYPASPFQTNTYSDHFTSYVMDVDGDGRQDIVSVGLPGTAAHWYRNSGQGSGHWQKTLLFHNIGTESPTFLQVVPGGLSELVCASGFEFGYLTPNPTSPMQPWIFHRIYTSPVDLQFFHGLGAGDIDGDGLDDIVTGIGWFKQPSSLAGDPMWEVNFFSFGMFQGAQMLVDDVDGDGDNDIVTSWDAHGYGLGWFENENVGGSIQFSGNLIMSTDPAQPGVQFSQIHALALVDMDGDGLKDIVTGKTTLAHNGTDPGAQDPSVLYWFRLDRSSGSPVYHPVLIDDDSGLGRDFVVADLNGDDRMDIVCGNKNGVHIFRRAGLWTNVTSIPVATGGDQMHYVQAGASAAGGLFWIVGSLSGTSPGFLFGGAHIQLNIDQYMNFMIANPAAPGLFTNLFGVLNPNGEAMAVVTVPGGLTITPPLTANYAYVVWDSQLNLLRASNATPLTLF